MAGRWSHLGWLRNNCLIADLTIPSNCGHASQAKRFVRVDRSSSTF